MVSTWCDYEASNHIFRREVVFLGQSVYLTSIRPCMRTTLHLRNLFSWLKGLRVPKVVEDMTRDGKAFRVMGVGFAVSPRSRIRVLPDDDPSSFE